MKSPCINCEKKGCGRYHDECEKYKIWKQELEKINEQKNLEWLTRHRPTYKKSQFRKYRDKVRVFKCTKL